MSLITTTLTQHEYDWHPGGVEAAAAARVAVHMRRRIYRRLLPVGHGAVSAVAALDELVAVAPHEGGLEVPLVLVLQGHL